ncbi:hypothetical protein [Oceanibium sediminis]|uniref:hypothetical protein n=1 Tax=Oceanibium sediminis TaxID=2026339 RepID=UPI000DD3D703|nr:hypothetical protein [Oceanibium sediminis]
MTDMPHSDRAAYHTEPLAQRILARSAMAAEQILNIQLDKSIVRKYAIRFSILYAMTGVFWYVASRHILAVMNSF